MGLDPAYRTGCKIAVIDPSGNVIDTTVIYPTPPHNKIAEANKIIGDLIEKDGSLVGPRAYLRDSDAIYWLEAKGGNLFLTVNSKRLGKNHVFEGSLIADPNSSRMKEE